MFETMSMEIERLLSKVFYDEIFKYSCIYCMIIKTSSKVSLVNHFYRLVCCFFMQNCGLLESQLQLLPCQIDNLIQDMNQFFNFLLAYRDI